MRARARAQEQEALEAEVERRRQLAEVARLEQQIARLEHDTTAEASSRALRNEALQEVRVLCLLVFLSGDLAKSGAKTTE